MKLKSFNLFQRFNRNLGIFAILVPMILPGIVKGGDHWLSRITLKAHNQPYMTLPAKQISSVNLSKIMQTSSSTAVFDITISLDANPQGDDDWKVNDGANDSDQRAYEERIIEFANAVYQSTNGAHKIGKVTIYRDGALANSVDVLWSENCTSENGPRANPSGFGVAGKRIWMCTNWPESSAMSTAKGGGYTLAHEWGHYAYGLYDEYAQEQCSATDIAAGTCWEGTPRATDTAAVPAIMNNQWIAIRGDEDYLEHSTQDIHPHKADSTGTNAQKRVFGESAWETITRNSATDPKFSWLPTRTHYTTLAAPSDPNWIVNNDESSAGDELDIRWVGDQLVDLLIDRSGSMGGSAMSNAKTGANLLIDQIQSGTAIGVSSFASNVVRNFAFTDIPEPDTDVRVSAKTAINNLVASGLTSMYDGLMLSLTDLQAFDPNRTGVVYVLSDGYDNDSTATKSSVINAYRSAGVPIIAFAYGSYAPTGTLLDMANSTGGSFFQSPTNLPDIQAALLSAEAKFSDNVLITSNSTSIPSGITPLTIPLDSTLSSVLISFSYIGSQTDFTFNLLKPDGSNPGQTFTCEGSTSCSIILDEMFFASNGYGDYQVQLINNTATPEEVAILVSASPVGVEDYDIAVDFSSSKVNYPANMSIRATVTKGEINIAGLDVIARVNDPDGNSIDVKLFDDGIGADVLRDDGIYTGSIQYKKNGMYSAVVTASNEGGNAQTNYNGVMFSLTEDGTAPLSPHSESVIENFARVGTASTIAEGVMSDDHDNDPTSYACTTIFDNNADTFGRIDYADDADCFTFKPSSMSSPIVVRVTSLTLGIEPLLTIFDSTGTAQIGQVDLATSENPNIGIVKTIPTAQLDPDGVVFVVQHFDPSASTGGYAVSAGLPMTSDANKVDGKVKVKINLNFRKPSKDKIQVKIKKWLLPENITPSSVSVNVGGNIFTGTLNAKGKYRSADKRDTIIMKKNKKGLWQLTVKRRKGDFAGELADEGLSNANNNRIQVTVPLSIQIDGYEYTQSINLTYKSRVNKTGWAK